MGTGETDKVLEKMRVLCSRREYCRSDILKKVVSALDGDRQEAEKIIDILVNEKFIDELRYASAFVRDKSALSGWGAVKIRYMLSSKGIPREVISEALGEVDEGKAHARLEKLMENRYRSLKDDPQCRMKMLRFGLGRGYEYDEVSSVIDMLMKH